MAFSTTAWTKELPRGENALREEVVHQLLTDMVLDGRSFNFVELLTSEMTDSALLLHCEHIEDTLADFKTVTLSQARELLFQILCAIATGQQECELVHYDLHSRNVLIRRLANDETASIKLDGKLFYLQSFIVKITDFGLSRVRLPDGRVLHNTKDLSKGAFDVYHDQDKSHLT